MRYEIKDIKPPEQIKRSMELQAESERIKRSKILNSEGERDSAINAAIGIKQSLILEGEGQAQQIRQEARSICESLDQIAGALEGEHGVMNEGALRLRLSQQYVAALGKIYGEAKIVAIPQGNGSQTDSIVTALELYKQIVQNAPEKVDD